MTRCGCGTEIVNETCACSLGIDPGLALSGSGNSGDPWVVGPDVDAADGNALTVSASGLFVSGIVPATSAERAALTPDAGVRLFVYETDTDLIWVWDGAAWTRPFAKGLLGEGSDNSGNFTNATTSYTTVVGSGSVDVPDGTRALQVTASWSKGYNTAGSFACRIAYATAAAPTSKTLIAEWTEAGDDSPATSGAGGRGGSHVVTLPAGLAADTYVFTFEARSIAGVGGTTTIEIDSSTPVQITVVEV